MSVSKYSNTNKAV